MSALLEAALEFVRKGQPCFPCARLGKRPATRNGFHNATTDEEQIRAWWTNGDWNLGLPTGILFDVIDVDGIEGMDALEVWAAEHGVKLPDPTVITPSGGYHLWMQPSGYGNRAGMLPHVDYRGVGGYVLAPPSKLPHGMYRWH